MSHKISLAFLLSTSPRGACSLRQSLGLLGRDDDNQSRPDTVFRPLTAYLQYYTDDDDDGARVDRVCLRALCQERPQIAVIERRRRELPGKTRESGADGRKSSKFCVVDGCASRAKHARRCWKHGGSVKCKVSECANRAKSKGVCWSHGGGSRCSVGDCGTIAVSNGFCWAHGGGKRCRELGCSRPAYARTRNYCAQHFQDLPSTSLVPVRCEGGEQDKRSDFQHKAKSLQTKGATDIQVVGLLDGTQRIA